MSENDHREDSYRRRLAASRNFRGHAEQINEQVRNVGAEKPRATGLDRFAQRYRGMLPTGGS